MTVDRRCIRSKTYPPHPGRHLSPLSPFIPRLHTHFPLSPSHNGPATYPEKLLQAVEVEVGSPTPTAPAHPHAVGALVALYTSSGLVTNPCNRLLQLLKGV